jgi:hypothetical protein
MKPTSVKEFPASSPEPAKPKKHQAKLTTFAKSGTSSSIKGMLRSYKGGKRGVSRQIVSRKVRKRKVRIKIPGMSIFYFANVWYQISFKN